MQSGAGASNQIRWHSLAYAVGGRGFTYDTKGLRITYVVRGGASHIRSEGGASHAARGRGFTYEIRGQRITYAVSGQGFIYESITNIRSGVELHI